MSIHDIDLSVVSTVPSLISSLGQVLEATSAAKRYLGAPQVVAPLQVPLTATGLEAPRHITCIHEPQWDYECDILISADSHPHRTNYVSSSKTRSATQTRIRRTDPSNRTHTKHITPSCCPLLGQTRPSSCPSIYKLALLRSGQRALPAWLACARPVRPVVGAATINRSRASTIRIMAPTNADQKADKSYLSSAVESLNPWGPRSTTPTPGGEKHEPPSPASTVAPSNDPQDHAVGQLYGQSVRRYPTDCPPLRVQWFHAVDVSLDGGCPHVCTYG